LHPYLLKVSQLLTHLVNRFAAEDLIPALARPGERARQGMRGLVDAGSAEEWSNVA
jgi:hypothetical protein